MYNCTKTLSIKPVDNNARITMKHTKMSCVQIEIQKKHLILEMFQRLNGDCDIKYLILNFVFLP